MEGSVSYPGRSRKRKRNREVSRSHSTGGKEGGLLTPYPPGLTNREGLNVKTALILAGIHQHMDSLPRSEQEFFFNYDSKNTKVQEPDTSMSQSGKQ